MGAFLGRLGRRGREDCVLKGTLLIRGLPRSEDGGGGDDPRHSEDSREGACDPYV